MAKRWIGAVVAAVLVAGAAVVVWRVVRTPSTTVNGSVVLTAEGTDWERVGALSCRGINGATAFDTGSEVTFVGADGEVDGRFVISSFAVSMGGSGVPDCTAFFNHVDIREGEERYDVRLDGVSIAGFTGSQLRTTRTPDVYPGVGVIATDCATTCTVTTSP